jgi:lipopolysaccharide export system protein LptC
MSLFTPQLFATRPPTSEVRGPISILLALVLSAGAFAVPIETSAPVKKFSLPTFTPEGPRSMLLRGDEARFKTSQQIDISEMQLTIFDGKMDEKVETVFVSAEATFYPARQIAEGDKGVRVIRSDVEMSGLKWIYEHKQKKVVIDGKVHVIFRAQMKDILK